MEGHEHHEDLLNGVVKQLNAILNSSDQGIYVYLDDRHTMCNKNFATLLGYNSTHDLLNANTKSFLDAYVDETSQDTLAASYQNAIDHMIASVNQITWKKKDGSRVLTQVILAPISFEDHLFALHFITKAS